MNVTDLSSLLVVDTLEFWTCSDSMTQPTTVGATAKVSENLTKGVVFTIKST